MVTAASEALFQRGLKVLVEGVSSASRGPAAFATHRRYMSHGAGARFYDVDGNAYLETGLGWPTALAAVLNKIGGEH